MKPTRSRLDLDARGRILALGQETRIMGILNCTPDSFSGDGMLKRGKRAVDTSACLRQARRLLADGADILDVGGESTRPGARPVAEEEEIRRVVPLVAALAKTATVPISVDTSKYEVARRALDAGASIINNVMAYRAGPRFLKLVRDYEAAIVLMHMRGTPATMASKARYADVIHDVTQELKISVEKCLEIGIKKGRIIVDPGIGFAKTVEQNLRLINHLEALNALQSPILLGPSRKSFIGKILNQEVSGRLMGTAAAITAGVMRGAHIVRVHDVKAIKETLKLTDSILNAS